MRIFRLIARSPRLFALSQKVAALGTRLAAPFSEYVRLPAFTGWGYSKDLPRFAARYGVPESSRWLPLLYVVRPFRGLFRALTGM
mgnify:CR=1 FL=1